MLIIFKASEDNLAQTCAAELTELVSELIRASSRGYHLVLIKRSVCAWAINNLELNAAQKAHLKKLKSEYTTKADVDRHSLYRITISIGCSEIKEVKPGYYEIGHRTLLNTSYLSAPTSLILENTDTDGQFYEMVFKGLKRHAVYKTYGYNPVFGGGAGVTSALRCEINKKTIIACIWDSDRLSPEEWKSPTIRNLIKEESRNDAVVKIFPTVCREVENHIPIHILKNYAVCPNYQYEQIDRAIGQHGGTELEFLSWHFFDVKDGLDGARLKAAGLPKNVADWIESTYSCQDNKLEEISIPGFGENVLNAFLACGPALSEFHRFTRTQTWAKFFKDFFLSVYWMLVTDSPRATSIV